MTTMMKTAHVTAGPLVTVHSAPIPEPSPGTVIVKVHIAASNPKDWKYILPDGPTYNGDDIAGIVHSVAPDVYEFRPGDRVVAFHRIMGPHGAYAQYAEAPASTTAHIAPHVSFHDAATIPLAALTAARSMYRDLRLPEPWLPVPDAAQTPFLVYGASGAVGAFAIKLAVKANIHPIVAVAGKGIDFVRTLIDPAKGDVVLDYRVGADALYTQMVSALSTLVPDGASAGLFTRGYEVVGSAAPVAFCARVMRADSRFAFIMPVEGEEEIKKTFRSGVEFSMSSVPLVNGAMGSNEPGALDSGFVWMRALARGLSDGWLKPHPWEVVPGGLEGVQKGLERLKAGEASAVKYVYEIVE